MVFLRRAIAIVCLAAIMVAALTPSSSILLWVVVVPLLLLITALPAIDLGHRFGNVLLPASPLLSSASSRAPPQSFIA